MRSTHRFPQFKSVACLLFCALACSVSAGEPAPKDAPKDAPKKERRVWQQLKADRLVSDESVVFASAPDIKKLIANFERTSLRGLIKEEDMSNTLMKALTGIRDAYIKGDGARTELELRRRSDEIELLLKLVPMVDGQAAIAIEAGAEGENKDGILFIASMPSGDGGEERQRALEELMEKHRAAQCTDPRFKDFDDQIGPYLVTRVECTDLKLVEAWAFVENLFVYGHGKGIVERALERYTRGGQGTLALHAGYQGVYKEVGRDEKGEALVYIQADARSYIKKAMNADASVKLLLEGKMNDLAGASPHMAVGISVADGNNAAIKERMFVRTGKAPAGQLQPCTGVSARFVQGDGLLYSAQNIANSSQVAKDLLGEIQKSGGKTGFSDALKKELNAQNDEEVLAKLDVFKGESGFTISYIPHPSASLNSVQDFVEMVQPVFFAELDRDNAVADASLIQLLNALQRASGQEYIFTRVGNVDIRYQKGAAPREEKTGSAELGMFANLYAANPQFQPFFTAWARVDLDVDGKPRKFLVLSDSLNAIKKAVQQSQFSRVSLSEDPAFKAFQSQFRENRQSIAFLDLKKLVDMVSTEMPRISRAAGMSRESIEALPNLSIVKDFMTPMAWASSFVSEPAGAVIECASPVGNLPLLGVGGALAWPAIVQKQQESVSQEGDERFKRLQLALHLYASDFDRLPPTLSDLYDAYIKKDDLKAFESPFRRGALKGSPQELDNPDMTNLIYVPGRSLQGLGSDVLVYEKEPTKLLATPDGTRLVHHVITVDGRKTWLPKAALERNLSGKVELITTNVKETPIGEKAAPAPKKP